MKTIRRLCITAAVIIASTLPFHLAASQLYNVNYVQNAGTYLEFEVNGTITTDGTLGAITLKNLAVVNLNVTTEYGSYSLTQPQDVIQFDTFATSSGLYLGGAADEHVTMVTDSASGLKFQLCYDPTGANSPMDSIYIQTLPNDGYFYYSATPLSAISLDSSISAESVFTSQAAASSAPEPGSVGTMAFAGLTLIVGSQILRLRRKKAA